MRNGRRRRRTMERALTRARGRWALAAAFGIPLAGGALEPDEFAVPGTVAQQVRLSASPLYAAAADAVAADVAVSSGRDRTRVRVVPQGDTEDRVTGFLIDARDVE